MMWHDANDNSCTLYESAGPVILSGLSPPRPSPTASRATAPSPMKPTARSRQGNIGFAQSRQTEADR